MLVLSRKSKESICFPGTGISIEVLEIKGSQVRLGIKAPDHVKILRGELAITDSGQLGLELPRLYDASYTGVEVPVNV